jgi:hypothetical protein
MALCVAAVLCAAPAAIEFRNIAAEAGLTQTAPNGGTTSKKFIIETTGSGVALFDYDNDGWADALILSGDGAPSRLYHNDGRGHFTDVSAKMGLTREGWAEGVCAGDFDNDGYTDLLITYWGQNTLYRNLEGKRFADVTEASGLRQDRTRYNTGCAFVDYDNDGRLDLFVANYLKFSFETAPKPGANPYCWYRSIAVNCGPRGLPFDRNLLYHNNGGGGFTDVSVASGIARPDRNYSLGVLTGDFNGDGFTDIYVACDQTPSILYMNRGDGTFSDEALLRGVAFDENGKAMSGMGLAAADYDGNGWLDIFRTNFSDERATLYRNGGKGLYDERTITAGMGHNTRYVGWGCAFADFDNDGWPDLVQVNGHAFPEVDSLKIDIRYKERALVYRNLGGGRFADISETAGPAPKEEHSARGLAVADIDNDGDLEVLVNNQGEAPSLWKLNRSPAGNWILVKLVGKRSNRSGIGARVSVTAGGRRQSDEVRSGGSYLSQGDLRLHFGLGPAASADRIEVNWPSGSRQVVTGVAANRVVVIEERP